MAKLNKPAGIAGIVDREPTRTTNYEGGMAFTITAKKRLYSRVVTCLVGEPKFYKETKTENGVTTVVAQNQDSLLLADLKEVATKDPEFILKLANYTRNKMNLRTIPIVMLVEASLRATADGACQQYVRQYAPHIIRRADELAEAVAYLQSKLGNIGSKSPTGSMPASLREA